MNPFERELDAIRIGLYEATKHMNVGERLAYLRSLSAPIHKELGVEPIVAPKASARCGDS